MVDNQIFLKKGNFSLLKFNISNKSNSIRQLQNGSTSMATVNDSARIASMAKKRKAKTKTGRGNIITNK